MKPTWKNINEFDATLKRNRAALGITKATPKSLATTLDSLAYARTRYPRLARSVPTAVIDRPVLDAIGEAMGTPPQLRRFYRGGGLQFTKNGELMQPMVLVGRKTGRSVVAHELLHIKQIRNPARRATMINGMSLPYFARPSEREAYSFQQAKVLELAKHKLMSALSFLKRRV